MSLLKKRQTLYNIKLTFYERADKKTSE